MTVFFDNFEVYHKYINNTLTTERKTVYIADENKRMAIIDSLTVDAGNPLTSKSVLLDVQKRILS